MRIVSQSTGNGGRQSNEKGRRGKEQLDPHLRQTGSGDMKMEEG